MLELASKDISYKTLYSVLFSASVLCAASVGCVPNDDPEEFPGQGNVGENDAGGNPGGGEDAGDNPGGGEDAGGNNGPTCTPAFDIFSQSINSVVAADCTSAGCHPTGNATRLQLGDDVNANYESAFVVATTNAGGTNTPLFVAKPSTQVSHSGGLRTGFDRGDTLVNFQRFVDLTIACNDAANCQLALDEFNANMANIVATTCAGCHLSPDTSAYVLTLDDNTANYNASFDMAKLNAGNNPVARLIAKPTAIVDHRGGRISGFERGDNLVNVQSFVNAAAACDNP